MSEFVIPAKPNVPQVGKYADDGSLVTKDNYETKIADYQDAAAQRRLTIQARQQEMTEESTMRSQMLKSEHDAMMAIINNFKA